MDLTPQAAQQTLEDIRQLMRQTRAALAAEGADWILMLWGLIWIVAFLGTQFLPRQAPWFWWLGVGVGVLLTVSLMLGLRRWRKVHSESLRRLSWRIFGFWALLITYACLWIFLWMPPSNLKLNLYLVTLAMFASVVMGLWLEARLLLVLSLAVTALALAGYFFWPAYYGLWMAVVGGGSLLGGGLYIRLKWR